MTTKDSISRYRPYRTRKKSALYGMTIQMLLGGVSNKTKSIHGRASDSFHQLDNSLHFLSGFLTLLPFLRLKRATQLQDDGEKLFTNAYDFVMSFGDPTVSKVRKLRIFNERIVAFVEKVERDAEREDIIRA
jgi:hypothetical protein